MAEPTLDQLKKLLTADEPEDLRRAYLAVPTSEPLLAGSTTPTVGRFREMRGSGIAIPASAALPAPIDYVSAYVTLSEYGTEEFLNGMPLRALIAALRGSHTRDTLVLNLALLNQISTDDDRTREIAGEFRQFLQPQPRERLENFLRGEPGLGAGHRFLARQPILAALRDVLVHGGGDTDDPRRPPLLWAILLSHAVAAELGAERGSTETIAGVPDDLFREILQLSFLYEGDDVWASVDRVARLWRVFGTQVKSFPLRSSAPELLREAAGLELEGILALGFALFAHISAWTPGSPAFLAADFSSDMDAEKRSAFTNLVGATVDEMADAFRNRPPGSFDYLPLQQRPVLIAPQGLLVLDVGFLWDRVTSGLYWIVHDHEKQRGEYDRQRWTQGFAEAVELMAEDQLRAIAPPDLAGGTTYYTEEDFERAYGDTKRCDAAVDFGTAMLLVEIVSGQLTIGSRVEGDLNQFRKDTERLVIAKCCQLDAACRDVLHDAERLTAYPAVSGLRVLPLLLVGGGYPVNPFTMAYVNERLVEESLLDHPLMAPLCIIDLGELEALEGLAERGESPISVLTRWKDSPLADLPLRNFVIATWGGGPDVRPSRMQESVEVTFARVIDVLALRAA